MDQHEKPDKLIALTVDKARGALGPGETTRGDTLVPMLVIGLVLIVMALMAVWMMM